MSKNDESVFETKQEPAWHKEPSLSRWNTYIVRTALKGLSGLLFAFSILPIIYLSWTSSTIYIFPIGLVTFILAIVVWIIFYKMERQFRTHAQDRAL